MLSEFWFGAYVRILPVGEILTVVVRSGVAHSVLITDISLPVLAIVVAGLSSVFSPSLLKCIEFFYVVQVADVITLLQIGFECKARL